MALFSKCAFALLAVGCSGSQVFQPRVAIQDLDALGAALHKMLEVKMTTSQANATKQVVADVENAVTAISSKNMSKDEKAQKFSEALKELTGLQRTLAPNATEPAVAANETAKLANLTKALAEKKAQLANVEGELKLDKLKKELAEKQLELNRLEQAAASSAQVKDQVKEATVVHAAVVKSLLAVKNSSSLKASSTILKGLPAPLRPIVTDLESHAVNVSAAIKSLDLDEKTKEADLDREIAKSSTAGTREEKKKAALLKTIRNQAVRSYKKIRAVKSATLGELKEAVNGIKSGDVAVLTKVIQKIQKEGKAFEAKQSKNFLH